LEEIITYLSAFPFTTDTHFQSLNNRRYEEVLHQLELWKNEAQEKALHSTSKVQHIDDLKKYFFGRIKTHIEEDNTLNERDKQEKWRDCKTLGEDILNNLKDDTSVQNALNNFNELPINFVMAELGRGGIEILSARFEQEGGNQL